MEQPKTPSFLKKGEGNPPLRRGQIRNRIIWDFFRSLAALGHPGWMSGGGGGSVTTTPTSSSADSSEATSDA